MTNTVERLVPGLSAAQTAAVTAALALVPQELREMLAVRVDSKLKSTGAYSDGAVLAAMADVLGRYCTSTEFVLMRERSRQ
jgi:hypothetical protein